MKKLLFALIIILIVIAGVYKIGMQYGSEVVIDKIANQVLSKDEIDQLIEDPKVQKTIEEQLGAGALQNLRKEQSNNGTVPDAVPNAPDASNLPQTGTNSQLVFATPEEALKFLLTKFSMSELNGFIKMADGGVTTAEKNQIKSALMSRLTPEEYQALKVLGLIELQKRQNSMNSN
ncbi:hypothetical protein Psch_01718 [Pelotomaculum schinkii]|uniref:Uncharacterized protein n=2 Tax=Pelotomaculum schinkii TaxID=78350 RepID=A0A4Y7RH96_9FIRM|nr:hypothetical protein Psch_01718 [Pelotomaculum schinkii]